MQEVDCATANGAGTAAEPGDATWIHTSYPDTFWMHNGGRFVGEPSARFIVGGPGVYHVVDDGLFRDAKLWSEDPRLNFGWILIGDETERRTVRAFASREHTYLRRDLRRDLGHTEAAAPSDVPAPRSKTRLRP